MKNCMVALLVQNVKIVFGKKKKKKVDLLQTYSSFPNL